MRWLADENFNNDIVRGSYADTRVSISFAFRMPVSSASMMRRYSHGLHGRAVFC